MKKYLALFLAALLLAPPAPVNEDELVYVEGIAVSSLCEKPLTEMLAAVRAEGLPVYLASGYRDAELSDYLYRRSLYLGESFENTDHDSGLAVDLTDLYRESKNESLSSSPTLIWLSEHCGEYGFTHCPEIAPWHFIFIPPVAEAEKPCYNKNALPARESALQPLCLTF